MNLPVEQIWNISFVCTPNRNRGTTGKLKSTLIMKTKTDLHELKRVRNIFQGVSPFK